MLPSGKQMVFNSGGRREPIGGRILITRANCRVDKLAVSAVLLWMAGTAENSYASLITDFKVKAANSKLQRVAMGVREVLSVSRSSSS